MSGIQNPGCVILLIDESAAMDAPIQEAAGPVVAATTGQPPKSKAASIATALNALLKRLGDGTDFDLALVGYRTDGADQAVVTSRWGGALAGREFVSVKELAANPVTVETRVRKIPNPAGFGPPLEEPVSFPIWFAPQPQGKAPQVAAFRRCHELLSNWVATAGLNPGVPLILHLFAGGSGDGNPQKVIEELLALPFPTGSPLLLQAHLSTSKLVPSTIYPSNRYYLPAGPQKDLFPRCSKLPDDLVIALKQAKQVINPNAIGMLYNAKMVDIAAFVRLVEAHTKSWPARSSAVAPVEEAAAWVAPVLETVKAAPVADVPMLEPVILEPIAELDEVSSEVVPDAVLLERVAFLAFVLDRSLADPFSGDMKNAFSRLQEHVNDLLGKLAKRPTGAIDVAIVSYGTDSMGDNEVRTSLEGNLSGQTIVRDSELADGALRVDEFEQQVPNGVGGLMTIPVRKPIFVELEPTSAASPVPAFAAVGQLLGEWSGQHPQSCVAPIVLHLTRGQFDTAELDAAIEPLKGIQSAVGPVTLCHLVVTETPHQSVVYGEQASEFDTAELQKLFEVSSPVLDRQRLLIDKPTIVRADARGIVVNGKIDLLLETVVEILGPA